MPSFSKLVRSRPKKLSNLMFLEALRMMRDGPCPEEERTKRVRLSIAWPNSDQDNYGFNWSIKVFLNLITIYI